MPHRTSDVSSARTSSQSEPKQKLATRAAHQTQTKAKKGCGGAAGRSSLSKPRVLNWMPSLNLGYTILVVFDVQATNLKGCTRRCRKDRNSRWHCILILTSRMMQWSKIKEIASKVFHFNTLQNSYHLQVIYFKALQVYYHLQVIYFKTQERVSFPLRKGVGKQQFVTIKQLITKLVTGAMGKNHGTWNVDIPLYSSQMSWLEIDI